jgi:hypothetical protein
LILKGVDSVVESKQVEKSHYLFSKYTTKARWNSLWHQVDEVLRLNPDTVLEIGPGPGYFKKMLEISGLRVDTLDVDLEIRPGCVGSATALPYCNESYDVVCAFQVLEHLPYNRALVAFAEMVRVSRSNVVISLPDARRLWRYRFFIPFLGDVDMMIPRPRFRPVAHVFDGEHYWELNKRGFSFESVMGDLEQVAKMTRTFRVPEIAYHRFLIFEKR